MSQYASNPGAASVLITVKAAADIVEEDVTAGPLVAVSGSVVKL